MKHYLALTHIDTHKQVGPFFKTAEDVYAYAEKHELNQTQFRVSAFYGLGNEFDDNLFSCLLDEAIGCNYTLEDFLIN